MGEHCDHCGGVDAHSTATGTATCALLAAHRADLLDYATSLDDPPTRAQVVDLWAHARQHRDDGGTAARWVRHVLDLGWRPRIGADS